jgi:hypothetical protein
LMMCGRCRLVGIGLLADVSRVNSGWWESRSWALSCISCGLLLVLLLLLLLLLVRRK